MAANHHLSRSCRHVTPVSPRTQVGVLPHNPPHQDVGKLHLVARLQKQGIPGQEILSRLEAGESDPLPVDAPQTVTDGPHAPAPLILVQKVDSPRVMIREKPSWEFPKIGFLYAMTALQDALQTERAERQDLAQRLQDAEVRAARLEAELSAAKMPWYRRLFG